MLKYYNYLPYYYDDIENADNHKFTRYKLNKSLDVIPAYAMEFPILDINYLSTDTSTNLSKALDKLDNSSNKNILLKLYYNKVKNKLKNDKIEDVVALLKKDYEDVVINGEPKSEVYTYYNHKPSNSSSYANINNDIITGQPFREQKLRLGSYITNYMYLADAGNPKVYICLMVKKEYIPMLQYGYILNKDILEFKDAFELWVDEEFATTSFYNNGLRLEINKAIITPLKDLEVNIVSKPDILKEITFRINLPVYKSIEEEKKGIKSTATTFLKAEKKKYIS